MSSSPDQSSSWSPYILRCIVRFNCSGEMLLALLLSPPRDVRYDLSFEDLEVALNRMVQCDAPAVVILMWYYAVFYSGRGIIGPSEILSPSYLFEHSVYSIEGNDNAALAGIRAMLCGLESEIVDGIREHGFGFSAGRISTLETTLFLIRCLRERVPIPMYIVSKIRSVALGSAKVKFQRNAAARLLRASLAAYYIRLHAFRLLGTPVA